MQASTGRPRTTKAQPGAEATSAAERLALKTPWRLSAFPRAVDHRSVFKFLKTGLNVEEVRFDHVDDLPKCFPFDATTACHVYDIVPRTRPN